MFEVGQMILYGSLGVCEIMNIVTQTICGTTDRFYVLRELHHDASTSTYVPVQSEILTMLMRPLMSKEQVMDLIREAPDIPPMDWMNEPHGREKLFREVIRRGSGRDLIAMIKSVLENAKLRNESGKKMFVNDENAMHHAQKNLYNEFSVVLGLPVEEIPKMLAFPAPEKAL